MRNAQFSPRNLNVLGPFLLIRSKQYYERSIYMLVSFLTYAEIFL